MAIVLTQETSLLNKKREISRETGLLSRLVYIELLAGILLTLCGGALYYLRDNNKLLVGGGILLFLAIGHWVKIRDNRKDIQNASAGRHGERVVTKILSRELSDRYYVINDANAAFGRKTAQIDHLVICPQGLFVLETKNWRGRLEGDEKENMWKQYRGDGAAPVFLHNPVEQNQHHIDVLRSFLKTRQLPSDINMISAIVMTNRSSSWEIKNQTVPLMTPDDLPDFISCYPETTPLEWDTIQAIVKAVTDQDIEEQKQTA